jgi:hypothetical protein
MMKLFVLIGEDEGKALNVILRYTKIFAVFQLLSKGPKYSVTDNTTYGLYVAGIALSA